MRDESKYPKELRDYMEYFSTVRDIQFHYTRWKFLVNCLIGYDYNFCPKCGQEIKEEG